MINKLKDLLFKKMKEMMSIGELIVPEYYR
jgi:hypothetical protein